MKYFSTRDKNNFASFKQAVLLGLAKDGGLFLPEYIPQYSIDMLNIKSFQELSFDIAKLFIGDEINDFQLNEIIFGSITFEAPVVKLDERTNVLELFHGPTLAFKDFGARFMARTMEHFVKDSNKHLTILVATSGDTGSAVAHGFYGVEGINVILLYPSKKVSTIQEMQLTTLDKNITALEIEGTFDDCQRLVKDAFLDSELTSKLNLSSANSINIARLIPQTFYYINAFKQIDWKEKEIVVSVPSGNLGNITAALFAKRIGLPIKKIIAATNSNNVFTEYITTGTFNARPSILTYSNAMDVGNPSNFERLHSIYNNSHYEMKKEIVSHSYNDEETVEAIKQIYTKFNYVMDPHGAVGFNALNKYLTQNKDAIGMVVETAHPAKFKDIVEVALNIQVEIPQRLAVCLSKEKKSHLLQNNYKLFKDFLLSRP